MKLSDHGIPKILRNRIGLAARTRLRLLVTLLALSVAAVFWADPVWADPVVVSGRIVMPNGVDAAGAAVIWLEAPGLHAEPPLSHAAIDQRNKTFTPHILVVSPGTKIQFPNNDTVFHNVFAYFEAKRFDLGMYPRGTTKTQIFDRPGIVAVLCNIHPAMSAFIVIIDSPLRTSADKSGEFQIHGVSPGTYTIHAWHESGSTYSAHITVTAGGNAPQRLTLSRD